MTCQLLIMIICLNEMWLNVDILDAKLGFTNYNLYTDDRNLTYRKSGF